MGAFKTGDPLEDTRQSGAELESKVSPKSTRTSLVVKIGGSTLGSGDTTLEDLVALQRQGINPVVVHGGGSVISEWMKRSHTLPRFVRGLRVTDAETLDVVVAVLAGLVNKQLVATIQALGGRAIGLSGVDGGLLQAAVVSEELGFVGEVVRVCPEPIHQALELGCIPVVAPVAIKELDGSREPIMLNINGDSAAGALAGALDADRLVFLTDVEGILDRSRRLIPRLSPRQAKSLIAGGVVSGGMIPKVEACLRALPRVGSTHIIDGRKPGALAECLGPEPVGTRIT
jgi:acetylglutamate kinase